MIKKERTEKQLLNDLKLKEKFRKINEIQKEIVLENEILPPPGKKLGRVRSRKLYYPYDLITDEDNKIIDIIQN